jgi:hypothetical protein
VVTYVVEVVGAGTKEESAYPDIITKARPNAGVRG